MTEMKLRYFGSENRMRKKGLEIGARMFMYTVDRAETKLNQSRYYLEGQTRPYLRFKMLKVYYIRLIDVHEWFLQIFLTQILDNKTGANFPTPDLSNLIFVSFRVFLYTVVCFAQCFVWCYFVSLYFIQIETQKSLHHMSETWLWCLLFVGFVCFTVFFCFWHSFVHYMKT